MLLCALEQSIAPILVLLTDVTTTATAHVPSILARGFRVQLHRFYAPEASVFSHGVEGEANEPAQGQQEINTLIMSKLATATGCRSVITQADCQYVSLAPIPVAWPQE